MSRLDWSFVSWSEGRTWVMRSVTFNFWLVLFKRLKVLCYVVLNYLVSTFAICKVGSSLDILRGSLRVPVPRTRFVRENCRMTQWTSAWEAIRKADGTPTTSIIPTATICGWQRLCTNMLIKTLTSTRDEWQLEVYVKKSQVSRVFLKIVLFLFCFL